MRKMVKEVFNSSFLGICIFKYHRPNSNESIFKIHEHHTHSNLLVHKFNCVFILYSNIGCQVCLCLTMQPHLFWRRPIFVGVSDSMSVNIYYSVYKFLLLAFWNIILYYRRRIAWKEIWNSLFTLKLIQWHYVWKSISFAWVCELCALNDFCGKCSIPNISSLFQWLQIKTEC